MDAGFSWKKHGWMVAVGSVIVVAVAASSVIDWKALLPQKAESAEHNRQIELASGYPAAVKLANEGSAKTLSIKVDEVKPAPAPEPLRLPGTLSVDPQRIVRVHSRFGGEIVSIGEIDDKGTKRQLRYGDNVEKGQLLAVVWSKEIGEKKAELIDCLSRLDLSEGLLKRLESLQNGVVAERLVVEARRDVEADRIALSRAERTLRSWRVAEDEIVAIRKEVDEIRSSANKGDARRDRKWAEIEVRAPISGVLIEKNFNVGDMVEAEDDLLKVADLQKLQVLANIYEEDLWEIRALAPEARKWSIDLKSDPTDNKIEGSFDLIGSVIDPAQRTGVLIGWLDNTDNKLAIGQFITATIQLPRRPHVVSVPETALIEEGDSTTVFVEVDASQRIFSRRMVQVVRRAHGVAYIDSRPEAGKGDALNAGERVVSQGALSMGGELANQLAARPLLGPK